LTLLPVLILGQPDWSYSPQLPVIPGADYLGWGFDAWYRDTFFALKPQLFNFSYNDNPKGSEKTYKYPVDTVTYAVPDQVFIRTVGKTTTNTYSFNSTNIMRTTIDLTLGVQMSTSALDGSLKFQFGYVDSSQTNTRIIRSIAMTELWQLYLGDHYLQYSFGQALSSIAGLTYTANKQAFYLFFQRYGTHYVDSVTVGGSVEQRTTIQSDNQTTLINLAVALQGKFQQASGTQISGQLGFNYNNIQQQLQTETLSSAIIYGGDAKFTDFVLQAGDSTAAADLYSSWKATLLENPVGVRYRLTDVWTLLQNTDQQKEVCSGIADFLGHDSSYCDKVQFALSGYERTGAAVPDFY